MTWEILYDVILDYITRGAGLAQLNRGGARFSHVNMYPWKHVPFDFENKGIMSTS